MATLTLLNNGEFPSIGGETMAVFRITSTNYAEEEAIWDNTLAQFSQFYGRIEFYQIPNVTTNTYFEFKLIRTDTDPFQYDYAVWHCKPGIVYLSFGCNVYHSNGTLISSTEFNNVRFDIKPTIFYLKNNTKIKHKTLNFQNDKHTLELVVKTKKLGGEGLYYEDLGNFTLSRFPKWIADGDFIEIEFEVCELLKSIFDYQLQGRTVQNQDYLDGGYGGTVGTMLQLYSGFVLYFTYRITIPNVAEIYVSPLCIAINGGVSPYSDVNAFPKFKTTSGNPDDFQSYGLSYLEQSLFSIYSNNSIYKANRYIALPTLNSYNLDDDIRYIIKPYSINYYADGTKYYLPMDVDSVQIPVQNTFIFNYTDFNQIDFSCLILHYTYFMCLFDLTYSYPVGDCVFKLAIESTSGAHNATIGSFILSNDLSGKVFIYLDELGMPQTAYFFEFFEVEQEVKKKLVENTNNTALDGTDKVFVLDTDVNRTFTFRSNPLTKAELNRYQQLLHSPSVSEIIDFARPYSLNNATIYPEFWTKQTFRKVIILDSKTIIDKGIYPLFTLEISFRYADNDYLTINNRWNYD